MSLGTAHKLTRPSTIVSVGSEGRSVDELVDALADAGVSVLVDVRENAISRKRGLSKRALAEKLQARGITYVHEPTLGNPRDNRDGFREQRRTASPPSKPTLTATGQRRSTGSTRCSEIEQSAFCASRRIRARAIARSWRGISWTGTHWRRFDRRDVAGDAEHKDALRCLVLVAHVQRRQTRWVDQAEPLLFDPIEVVGRVTATPVPPRLGDLPVDNALVRDHGTRPIGSGTQV